jgi:hypothetical protein
VLDLGPFDGNCNRRVLMHPVDPIVLTKDVQAPRHSLKETACSDFDGMFRAVRIKAPYSASSKSHASTLASSFFFRQKLDDATLKGVTEY